MPGAWWEKHVGRVILVLFTDSFGHWTLDTDTPGGKGWDAAKLPRWVKPEDTTGKFNGTN